MLSHQRRDCLQKLHWNQYFDRKASDAVSVFECWKFQGEDTAQEGVNWRWLDLYHEQRRDGTKWGSNEDELQKWLKWQDHYMPLGQSDPPGQVLGGIRLVFCERDNIRTTMTMSKDAYLMIEEEFKLHETTLPTFFFLYGTHAIFHKTLPGYIQLVAKVHQKVEVMNCTLSVTHNTRTGWTTAFICGEGVLLKHNSQSMPDVQRRQLLQSILSNHGSWNSPFLLSFALLETLVKRLNARAGQTGTILANLETDIGVTDSGTAGSDRERNQWPEDIDTRQITKDLHSESTEIIFLLTACDWTQDYAASLAEAINTNHHNSPIQEYMGYQMTTMKRVSARFKACQDRANLQINVLFNIISQQASITSRRDADLSFQVAKSSRQDGISANTFTAITAVYLPGSFIATMFSMSMFNWQAQGTSNSTTDGNGNSTGTTGTSSTTPYVTSIYWVFWVVTFPLTVVTVVVWKLYSDHANKKWLAKLEQPRNVEEDSDSVEPGRRAYNAFPMYLRRNRKKTDSSD